MMLILIRYWSFYSMFRIWFILFNVPHFNSSPPPLPSTPAFFSVPLRKPGRPAPIFINTPTCIVKNKAVLCLYHWLYRIYMIPPPSILPCLYIPTHNIPTWRYASFPRTGLILYQKYNFFLTFIQSPLRIPPFPPDIILINYIFIIY